MIRKIENWYLQRTQPSFNDVEGVTANDMVGKNTAKINEIIELVNTFTTDIESYIKEFTESTNKDYEAFKLSINQKIVDFIETVDLKLASQDAKLEEQDAEIAETVKYIRDNLEQYITDNFNSSLKELVDAGELNDEILSVFDNLQAQIDTINETLAKSGGESNSSVDTIGVVLEGQLRSGNNIASDLEKVGTAITTMYQTYQEKGYYPEIDLTVINTTYIGRLFTKGIAGTETQIMLYSPLPNYYTDTRKEMSYMVYYVNGAWYGSTFKATSFSDFKALSILVRDSNTSQYLNYNLGTSATPSNTKDYTTKGYVDNLVSGKLSLSNIQTVTGSVTFNAGDTTANTTIAYPSGFTYSNCIVLGSYYTDDLSTKIYSPNYLTVQQLTSNINCILGFGITQETTFTQNVSVVLMKLS